MVKALEWLIGKFSTDMGIDLGTANTLVCLRGQGIVICEPSVVAVLRETNKLLSDDAVGDKAKEMLGKAPVNVLVIRPLKDGVIADFEITEKMLRYFIRKVHKRSHLMKPRLVIAIPSGITNVERRAVISSAQHAGARKVYLVDEPMAAGIGAGLPIHKARASMIVDIGGGTTEVAVMSLFGLVNWVSIRIAGDEMDEAITDYIRRTYNLLIGEQMAERIKIELGSAYPLEEERQMEIAGRDTLAGLPRRALINSEEIREALREPVMAIVKAIRDTLETTPPELSADLVHEGIVLAGGGALLRGIDRFIEEEVQIPVKVCDDPMTCVAKGTGYFLDHLHLYKQVLSSGEGS